MTGPSFHFISGLPRSGSTLLAALLRQNPRVHAGMSGPVATLLSAMLATMSERNEFSVFIDDAKRAAILRTVAETYYASIDQPLVFDTSRGWCASMSLLHRLWPDAKLIACVRRIADVISSIERITQANALSPSGMFGYEPGGTVYQRASSLAASNGMVGYAYDALKQACYGPFAQRVLLVRYETLVSSPESVMRAIYGFIGEPEFAHDFEHVQYDVAEFDRRLGTPGLHKVAPRVAVQHTTSALPPDLQQKFANDDFWMRPPASAPAYRIV